jgi:curli biogenesis system outer membrane secretion channel CsgG
MFMAKKTTVILRDDVYQALKETAGNQDISRQINKILIEHFAKTESLFDVMKQRDLPNLRDHKDSCP